MRDQQLLIDETLERLAELQFQKDKTELTKQRIEKYQNFLNEADTEYRATRAVTQYAYSVLHGQQIDEGDGPNPYILGTHTDELFKEAIKFDPTPIPRSEAIPIPQRPKNQPWTPDCSFTTRTNELRRTDNFDEWSNKRLYNLLTGSSYNEKLHLFEHIELLRELRVQYQRELEEAAAEAVQLEVEHMVLASSPDHDSLPKPKTGFRKWLGKGIFGRKVEKAKKSESYSQGRKKVKPVENKIECDCMEPHDEYGTLGLPDRNRPPTIMEILPHH